MTSDYVSKYIKGKGFYERGKKQCIRCHKFVYTIGTRCIECGNALRTKPHSSSGRRRSMIVNPPVRH